MTDEGSFVMQIAKDPMHQGPVERREYIPRAVKEKAVRIDDGQYENPADIAKDINYSIKGTFVARKEFGPGSFTVAKAFFYIACLAKYGERGMKRSYVPLADWVEASEEDGGGFIQPATGCKKSELSEGDQLWLPETTEPEDESSTGGGGGDDGDDSDEEPIAHSQQGD